MRRQKFESAICPTCLTLSLAFECCYRAAKGKLLLTSERVFLVVVAAFISSHQLIHFIGSSCFDCCWNKETLMLLSSFLSSKRANSVAASTIETFTLRPFLSLFALSVCFCIFSLTRMRQVDYSCKHSELNKKRTLIISCLIPLWALNCGLWQETQSAHQLSAGERTNEHKQQEFSLANITRCSCSMILTEQQQQQHIRFSNYNNSKWEFFVVVVVRASLFVRSHRTHLVAATFVHKSNAELKARVLKVCCFVLLSSLNWSSLCVLWVKFKRTLEVVTEKQPTNTLN